MMDSFFFFSIKIFFSIAWYVSCVCDCTRNATWTDGLNFLLVKYSCKFYIRLFLARLHEVHRAIVVTSGVYVYVYVRVTLSVKVF